MTQRLAMVMGVLVLVGSACSGGSTTQQQTGHAYMKPSDCYSGLDAGALSGMVVCLPLHAGYCSHTCTTDTDCCKVAGECPGGIKEVCAPLQSNPQTYCFVSCAAADITATGDGGADSFCQSVAGAGFTCHSTGGGAGNKKFCGP
jgi:hypothetical protein